MKTIELKSSIHKIIDSIQSEQLLETLYDFLKLKESQKEAGIWETLTDDQKSEILGAYEESEDENNLVEARAIFKRLE